MQVEHFFIEATTTVLRRIHPRSKTFLFLGWNAPPTQTPQRAARQALWGISFSWGERAFRKFSPWHGDKNLCDVLCSNLHTLYTNRTTHIQ